MLLFTLTVPAANPPFSKSARRYLYILLHGEDGKSSSATRTLFKTGDAPGGLMAHLENQYHLKGYVFAFQMTNPAGSLDSWTREFSDTLNPTCWLRRAREEHKQFLRQSQGITDEAILEAMTPREFIVFAHSFGGLVLRNYICSPAYRGDIALSVFINTPHTGSDYPYILEVMETRGALNQLSKAADRTIRKVSSSDLYPGIHALFEGFKTYGNIEALLKDLKSMRQRMRNIQTTLTSAETMLKQSVSISGNQFQAKFRSAIMLLKKGGIVAITPDADKLKKLRLAANFSAAEQNAADFTDFSLFLNALSTEGFSNMEGAFTDLSDADMSAILFSISRFKQSFSVPLPSPSLSQMNFAEESAAFYKALSYPVSLFRANQTTLHQYDELQELSQRANQISFQPTQSQTLSLPAVNLSPFSDFESHPFVQGIENLTSIETSLQHLSDGAVDMSEAIALCQTLFQLSNTLMQSLGTPTEQMFYTYLETFRTQINTMNIEFSKLGGILAAKDLSAYGSLFQEIKGSTFFGEKIFAPDATLLSSSEAALAQRFLANLPHYFGPSAIIDFPQEKLKIIRAYIALLGRKSVVFQRPDLTGLSANDFALPEVFTATFDLSNLIQFYNQCIAILSQAGNLQAELADLYERINHLMEQLSSLSKDSPSPSTENNSADKEESDYLSYILLGLSVAKTLGPAENTASASAALSAIAGKLVKTFLDEIWKEVQNGAILSAGFSEMTRSGSSVRPSDPAVANMSSKNSNLVRLKSALPVAAADQALQQARYRIVYTTGVLTPTEEGTKSLDLVSGQGGNTEAMARAALEEKIEALTRRIKEALVTRIQNAISIRFSSLTAEDRNALVNGIKPEGDFLEAACVARKNGLFSDYRSLVEDQANQVLNAFSSEINGLMDKASDKAINGIIDRLKELEAVKKGVDFLDKFNPGMIISLYNMLKADGKEMTPGQAAFALYYSPLLKLGFYENGDFVVPSSSGKGEKVALFQQATQVQRMEYRVSDPLAPFSAISTLAIALDIARTLVPDPGTRETIRLSKIGAVNLLTLVVALNRQEALAAYFKEGHTQAISGLCQNNRTNTLLFEKPCASFLLPGAK